MTDRIVPIDLAAVRRDLERIQKIEKSEGDGPELQEAIWCFLAEHYDRLGRDDARLLKQEIERDSTAVFDKIIGIDEALALLLPEGQEAQRRQDLFTHFWGLVGSYESTKHIQATGKTSTVATFLRKLKETRVAALTLERKLAELRQSGDADFIIEILERCGAEAADRLEWRRALETAHSRPWSNDGEGRGEYPVEGALRALADLCLTTVAATRRELPEGVNPGPRSTLAFFDGTPKQQFIKSMLHVFSETASEKGSWDDRACTQFLKLCVGLIDEARPSVFTREMAYYRPLFKDLWTMNHPGGYRQAEKIQRKIDRGPSPARERNGNKSHPPHSE